MSNPYWGATTGTATTGSGAKSVTLTNTSDQAAPQSVLAVSITNGGSVSVPVLSGSLDGTNYGAVLSPTNTVVAANFGSPTHFHVIGPDFISLKCSLSFSTSGTLAAAWSTRNPPVIPRPLPHLVQLTATGGGAAPQSIVIVRPSELVSDTSTVGVTVAGTEYTDANIVASIDGTNYGPAMDPFGTAFSYAVGGLTANVTTHYQVGPYSHIKVNLVADGGVDSVVTVVWAMRTQ